MVLIDLSTLCSLAVACIAGVAVGALVTAAIIGPPVRTNRKRAKNRKRTKPNGTFG